jgi:predicted metal-binding protein
MACEVCGDATSAEHSDEPADGTDAYTTLITRDDERPEGALDRQKFEFCSVECLSLFAQPETVDA